MSQTTLNYQVVNSLEDALDSKNDKGSSSNTPFSRAQVLRTDDDGITWVHIAGGVQETPANGGSVTSVKDRDQVLVNISDGKCSIIGNLTAPSSDDTEAKSAKETAISASKNSKDAEEQAKKAAESSNTNWQRLFTDSQVWTVAPKGSQPSTSPMDWTTEKPTNIQPGVQVWSATRRLYNDSVVELHDIVPYTGIVSQTTYYWQTIVPENGTVPDKPTGIEPEGWLQTPPPLASSDAKDEYANANIYSSVRTFYGDGSYAWSDPSRNGFASTWVNNVYTLQSVKSQTEVNAEAITKHSTSIEQNAEKIETNAKSIKTVQDSSDANATDLANYILEQKATNESLQGQIDGSIMTWFYEVPPTVDNEPANAWTTDKLKNQHLGDLYYDTKTGYCYRYQLFNDEYSWQQITDVDITKALADAKTAQDLADNKRRVFVETPKPPYDSGDLWVQGSTGDILVCRTPKTSEQSYAESDWRLASKYTDNSYAETKFTETSEKIEAQAKKIEANTTSIATVTETANGLKTSVEQNTNNISGLNTAIGNKADSNSVYTKTEIDQKSDSITSTAKSYADTKNKIFTDTPVPPYRVGDLWAQGSSGDIKVCIKAKTENQTYAATDWALASKYTDDSSLNTFKTEYNTYVTQTAKEIKAKASQTDVDSLGNRVTTAESEIKANSDSIKTEVTARKATDENLANNYSKTGQDSSYDKAGSADKALTTAKSYTDQTATSITQSVSENLAASNSTIKQLADSITSGVTGAKEITLPDGTVQTTIDFSQVQQSADSVKFMFGNDYPTSGDNLADMLSNVFDEASKIATNYITEITGSGIKVHPSTGSGYVQISDNIKVASNDNNYAQIDSDKYSIISNGETVSSFGEDEINLGNNSKNSYLYLSKKSGAISGIYRDINGSDTTGTRFNDNSLRLETSDYYGFDGKRTIDAVIQGNIGYYPLVVSGGNISGYHRSSTLRISASVYDNSYDYGYDVNKGSAGLSIYAGIGSNTSGELDPKAYTDIDISANTITFEADHLQSYGGISFAYNDDSTHTYFPLYSVAVDTSGYAYRWSADGKWVRVTVNDIVAANAAAHNAIYRGKDITSMETSGELYVNIANGTFDDIYIGDYFTKSINGTNYVLRIAAFNYYYNMGDPAFTKPHAVIIPDSTFDSAKMNSSNVVTGGYVGTKMRTETLQTWLKYLKTAFGSHLLTPRCWYDNKCDGSSYSGGAWYDGPLELMTEEQVYGARQQGITNHIGWYYPGVDYAQFPLFALDHSRICNRSRWWLRSVYSSTSFTYVSYLGTATYDVAASSGHVGVRPRFLIG